MGCKVYANGNEIACKAGGGKVIAAFPDVCLSPPSPPAGPIPVPYPDTSFAKDTKNGSKTVKIKKKEVMLKDKSFYKSSPLGNEAATKSLGAGVVTHVITGKTYFTAWSMDVKFEGANVDRHIDLTTSNHASPAGNSMIMANLSELAQARIKDDKCPCCGKPPHSEEQKKDLEKVKAGDPSSSLSEAEFYDTDNNPANKQLLENIRADPDCKHILPDESKPECNNYYKTTPTEAQRTAKRWGDHKRRHGLTGNYSHRVPKAAGGCHTGENAVETTAQCQHYEEQLEAAQTKRLLEMGWRTHRS